MVVKLAQMLRMMRMEVSPAAPPVDLVAVKKIWMIG